MLTFVLGAGGLLGSNVRRALTERTDGGALFEPERPMPWKDEDELLSCYRVEVDRFLRSAPAHGRWAIVWCAGSSVVASDPHEVHADRRAFEGFLNVLEDALEEVPRTNSPAGHVMLASSAGGVFAGHLGGPITEATSPRPISDYGEGQLGRERALGLFARRRPLVRTAVIRLTNLYGPGQRLDKNQGLVSQIALRVIQRQPVHVYVPLDTVRDYLHAGDAGRGMVAVLDRLARTPDPGPEPLLKILASEEEVSVGGLLAVFRQIARRRVAVVSGLSPLGVRQPLHLRFRSEVWTSAGRERKTPLAEGVAQVYRHLLREFCSGSLAVPA